MENAAVQSALAYLTSCQQPDGSFSSYSSLQKDFRESILAPSPFVSTLIVSILSQSTLFSVAKPQLQKAVLFLLSQKSKNWTWNYWIRTAQQAKTNPYPDDLDDTFCALSALTLFNKSLITGDVLAQVVMVLNTLEKKVGGPYKTWLVASHADKMWQDVDVAVNANIGYFLSLHDIDLPELQKYFDKKIHLQNMTSPYYVDIYPVTYFLSRFYHGKYVAKLTEILLAKRKKEIWENPLQTALAVSSLLNLGMDVENLTGAIAYLSRSQNDGHWKAYPFVNEKNTKNGMCFGGSEALTTALCVEAIEKYTSLKNKKVQKNSFLMHESVYKEIMQLVQEKLSGLPTKNKDKAKALISRLIEKDSLKVIPLLPAYFAGTLEKKSDKQLLITLGMANIFGWLAYTLFDDFYDGDETDMTYLSLANFCAREMQIIFTQIGSACPDFQNMFETVLDGIDNANNWELSFTRFIPNASTLDKIKLPRFGNLQVIAQKSLGHALGPVALLLSFGLKKDDTNVTALLAFFTHFLIAKQLNDDAHDWEEDLSRGQINPVSALLLKKWKKTSAYKPTQKMTMIGAKLKEFYWVEVAPDVSRLIFTHLKKAENVSKHISVVTNDSLFVSLLSPIRSGTKKAVEERESMLTFLKTYKGK